MNFETLMVFTVVFIGLILFANLLRKKYKQAVSNTDGDIELETKMMRWGYRGILIILVLFTVFILQRFGYLNIPKPFQWS